MKAGGVEKLWGGLRGGLRGVIGDGTAVEDGLEVALRRNLVVKLFGVVWEILLLWEAVGEMAVGGV